MLPIKNRLTKKIDFQRVLKKGNKIWSKSFFVKLEYNHSPNQDPRFAFIVSTKISKLATVRNRIKRQLRESIRTTILPHLVRSVSVVIIANQEITKQNQKNISDDLKLIFYKLNLIAKSK